MARDPQSVANAPDSILPQRYLHYVELAAAVAVGAAGDVPHVHFVRLARRDFHRRLAVGFQSLGPGIERFGIVRLQRLNAGRHETCRLSVTAQRRMGAKLAAGEDLALNEFGESNVVFGPS